MSRFDESVRYLAAFADQVDVRCPRCARRAVVIRGERWSVGRVACGGCGFAMNSGDGRSGPTSGRWLDGDRPVDPVLGLDLWLQAPCEGHVLWAYNARHLAFLRNYVESPLRRREPNRNGSLASRLPAWLKAASNRSAVLSAISKLEQATDSDRQD